MRLPLLHTLSGRIILGFTVLTLTFGTISALIVRNMELLGRQIRLVRIAYLPLALESKNLDEKQESLWSYLFDELAAESSPKSAEKRLVRYQQARSKSLRDIDRILAELAEVPAFQSAPFAEARRQVEALNEDVTNLADVYRLLISSPPLDNLADAPNRSAAQRLQYQKSRHALEALRASESTIRADIKYLSRQQNDQVLSTALTLEDNGERVRVFASYVGIAAVLISLVVTVWATMTLRSLQRLRAAAKRIAEGEYTSRIEEKGPAEVVDLAREFNVMGQAIEERERELVRSERLIAVGKMSAVITHEVRNPLSAIGLNTELLEEELAEMATDTEEARSLCRAITKEVDRLTAITEEYLQFARLPKPKLQTERINPILRNLAEFEGEQIAARGVHLHLDLADDLPTVAVDDAQMRQALLNLLRNAADAVEESGGGEVIVCTRAGAPSHAPIVEISVTDTGNGIAEEILPKLFEPFFSTKQGGTGLGLAVTHQIIREHGGQLQVKSDLGVGATFVIGLPAALPQ